MNDEPIVTRKRIEVLCNISRWGGWVNFPYSVGDHTLNGLAMLMAQDAPKNTQVGWLMHDLHETEFVGDIPTPHKTLYTNERYRNDVEAFDIRLGEEIGLDDRWWTNPRIKAIDKMSLIVENAIVYSGNDETIPTPSKTEPKSSPTVTCCVANPQGSSTNSR